MNVPRVMDDGTLAFPQRGPYPGDRPGYVRDPGQPYHLLLVTRSCKHLQSVEKPCNCPGGGTYKFSACGIGIPLKAGTCNTCTKREAPDPMADMWSELETQTNPSADWLADFIARIPCPECREKFVAAITQAHGEWDTVVAQTKAAMKMYFETIP